MGEFFDRKGLRLKNYDYSSGNYYYITLVTANRKKILSEIINGKIILSDIGRIVEDSIDYLQKDNIQIPIYIIMPNHIHMILGDVYISASIIDIIRKFKGYTGWLVRKKYGESLWQRSYYEKIIRSEAQYRAFVKYIQENPIKWQLDKYNRLDGR